MFQIEVICSKSRCRKINFGSFFFQWSFFEKQRGMDVIFWYSRMKIVFLRLPHKSHFSILKMHFASWCRSVIVVWKVEGRKDRVWLLRWYRHLLYYSLFNTLISPVHLFFTALQYCEKVMQTMINKFCALFSRFIADISAKHLMDRRTLKC